MEDPHPTTLPRIDSKVTADDTVVDQTTERKTPTALTDTDDESIVLVEAGSKSSTPSLKDEERANVPELMEEDEEDDKEEKEAVGTSEVEGSAQLEQKEEKPVVAVEPVAAAELPEDAGAVSEETVSGTADADMDSTGAVERGVGTAKVDEDAVSTPTAAPSPSPGPDIPTDSVRDIPPPSAHSTFTSDEEPLDGGIPPVDEDPLDGGIPPEVPRHSPSLIEEVWNSIFTPGVNSRVQTVINASFIGLFLSLAALAVVTGGNLHVLALIAIAACLFFSLQWFIRELAKLPPPNQATQAPTTTTTTTTTTVESKKTI
ncbi:hypothetical protein HK104_010718 [Borealophlyctis nickersoniae]|nr:hypothetical protein HK104_010718 [Borealophlyctis nickersoniae]